MLYWLHKPAYLPGTGNKPEKKENIMAETTKENRAQRAKKYRKRRMLVGAAGLVLCVGVAFGIDGIVTARANTALADALASSITLDKCEFIDINTL